mgnify:CR=1 FL=1
MKVLIISHNPMSIQTSIGKTLVSLFASFKKEELCQLYVSASKPEKDLCSSCFRITDKSALKGIFTRRVKGGAVEAEENAPLSQAVARKSMSSANRNKPYVELLRDAVWMLSPWYNKALRQWVNQQKPDCIFVAVGSSKFLYNMALRISKDFSIPVYTYVCDDFYTMKTPRAFMGSLWSFLLRRKTRQLLSHSKGVVSICPEMSEVYQKEFGCPAATVMTGTNFTLAKEPRVNESAKTLRYFGKVSLNRYRSLADIAEVIDEINSQQGTDYTLEIYCGGASPTEEKALGQYKCIKMFDFISGKQFEETFFSSDALVHIEAFDEDSIERVRHSVSTKIADSMACGIPLLAYGPKEIASIGHLLRNECAFTATDKEQLFSVLQELFGNYQLRYDVAQRALETAAQYHDPEKASNRIKEIVSGKML